MRQARAAAGFDAADFLHRRAAEGVAERLGDVKRAFPNVATFGGAGLAAEALRGGFGIERLVQVELAPEMAARAAARAPWAQTAVGEGPEALPERDYDLIVDLMTLHVENDPVGALVRRRMALKPDGLLIAALFAGGSLRELRAALAEAEAAEEGGLSPRVAPMAELRDLGGLLQRAGFALPVADLDGVTVRYRDPFRLMRELRAMGEANPLAGRRRGFTRRATLLRAAAIYAESFGDAEGVPATAEIAFLTGWSPGPGQPQPARPGSATHRLAEALGVEERPTGEKARR